MAVSRSAFEYMQRHGLLDETFRPAPRLAVGDLLVHRMPLDEPHEPAQAVRRGYEGNPSPDRGAARPWPNQEEAVDG